MGAQMLEFMNFEACGKDLVPRFIRQFEFHRTLDFIEKLSFPSSVFIKFDLKPEELPSIINELRLMRVNWERV